MIIETSIDGKDVDYGFCGEIVAVAGKSIAVGPQFSKTKERQIMLNNIAKQLEKTYPIMRYTNKNRSTQYELWYGGNKYSMTIYVPVKEPKGAAASYNSIASTVAKTLNKKVYLNMVELFPGTYLKLTKRREKND